MNFDHNNYDSLKTKKKRKEKYSRNEQSNNFLIELQNHNEIQSTSISCQVDGIYAE